MMDNNRFKTVSHGPLHGVREYLCRNVQIWAPPGRISGRKRASWASWLLLESFSVIWMACVRDQREFGDLS
jgi:hypothetical protein